MLRWTKRLFLSIAHRCLGRLKDIVPALRPVALWAVSLGEWQGPFRLATEMRKGLVGRGSVLRQIDPLEIFSLFPCVLEADPPHLPAFQTNDNR